MWTCDVLVISGYLCVVLRNCTGSIILVPGIKKNAFCVVSFILYIAIC